MKLTVITAIILLGAGMLVSACSPAAATLPLPSQTRPIVQPTRAATATAEDTLPPPLPTDTATAVRLEIPTNTNSPSATPGETSTVPPTQDPAAWQSWPVVPQQGVSDAMKKLYLEGLAQGNDSHKFSKIGDCQNIPTYFLATFDKPNQYNLGSYSTLQETIDWYSGSFRRQSVAVRGGMNVAAVQNPLWTKSTECQKGENPLACEIRLNQPSVIIVSYEELWNGDTVKYTRYYESLLKYILDHKIVPILATTANNPDANLIVSTLAVKYQIPVWNLYAGLAPLRHHGIVDGFHLTQWGNIFDFTSPKEFSGWHVRNLTALQSIDAVRRSLTQP